MRRSWGTSSIAYRAPTPRYPTLFAEATPQCPPALCHTPGCNGTVGDLLWKHQRKGILGGFGDRDQKPRKSVLPIVLGQVESEAIVGS